MHENSNTLAERARVCPATRHWWRMASSNDFLTALRSVCFFDSISLALSRSGSTPRGSSLSRGNHCLPNSHINQIILFILHTRTRLNWVGHFKGEFYHVLFASKKSTRNAGCRTPAPSRRTSSGGMAIGTLLWTYPVRGHAGSIIYKTIQFRLPSIRLTIVWTFKLLQVKFSFRRVLI